jgi:hypothetical protein
MPVYKISHADLEKMADKEANPHWFLAENAQVDHGTHVTIMMNHRNVPMLVERLGIAMTYVHETDHEPQKPSGTAL